MKYQLVCLDIDGTLVTDEKKLLPEVKESIRRAAKKGIRIALVSGRMPSGVERIEEELGVECIKICKREPIFFWEISAWTADIFSLRP